MVAPSNIARKPPAQAHASLCPRSGSSSASIPRRERSTFAACSRPGSSLSGMMTTLTQEKRRRLESVKLVDEVAADGFALGYLSKENLELLAALPGLYAIAPTPWTLLWFLILDAALLLAFFISFVISNLMNSVIASMIRASASPSR